MPSLLDSLAHRSDAPTPRRRTPAWLLPLAIGAAFLLLFFALFRDRLLPARSVHVAVVLATPMAVGTPLPDAAMKPGTGTMLFQASGWIEPDPLPVRASALIDGVVASVEVLEGESVRKDQLLATLVDDDAELALKTAQNNHRRQVSTHAALQAAIVTQQQKLVSARAAVVAAEATRDLAEDVHLRTRDIRGGAISGGEVVAARLRFSRDQARSAMAAAGVGEIESEIARLEIETTVQAQEIEAASIEVEKAALGLARTRIVSPLDGRVLRLLAMPGQKRMLGSDDENSSTLAIVYDPQKLQVRVDVPLADAAGLQIGQAVRIHCGLLQDRTFHGEVTRISGEADLQRNTLQAKVRILDPADELRPEMLCRAEFLSSSNNHTKSPNENSAASLTLWIPETSIVDGSAWVCDPRTKRVAVRPVEPHAETRDGYRRIASSLRPGEWVVVEPQGLENGQRVNPNLTRP
ncbi:MAG: HlyD family efflux transporter periplasmic adaptor subunit [Verrucomicrobiota bacterium]